MFGADHTTGPLRWLCQAIFGPVSDARWDIIHHLIRKTGHFLGYGLHWAGVAARLVDDAAAIPLFSRTRCSRCWEPALWPAPTNSTSPSCPTAPASPWDVLLDCCGALTMQLLVYVVHADLQAEAAGLRRQTDCIASEHELANQRTAETSAVERQNNTGIPLQRDARL